MSSVFTTNTDESCLQQALCVDQDPSQPPALIPVDQIRESQQVRGDFSDDDQSLVDLAQSISDHGVIQPVTIRPHPDGEGYEMIAGARRLRAARIAGLEALPALVKPLNDTQAAAVQMAENIHRKNLTQVELARQIQHDLSQCEQDLDRLAAQYGKSKAWFTKHLALLDLPSNTSRLIQHSLTDDLEVIYTMRRIEQQDAETARSLVDQIADQTVEIPLRNFVQQAKASMKPSKSTKSKRKPGKRKPAKMPKPTSKTQAIHDFYNLVIHEDCSGRDALEMLSEKDRRMLLQKAQMLSDEGAEIGTGEIHDEIVRLIRRNELSGPGALLIIAYLHRMTDLHEEPIETILSMIPGVER
ncbi:ParB/RepB/Spo0J family partition protein [Ectothiorhodospira variabilis]|uniref:ParB/RepB/Spo0J family partition protein n=1 Tax=Ectothiorhodospira variabilis TaxID=505694 RepID=UPI001EFBC562|nr:ParB/RepB/Spo0J family partition protein [Ectothiorhodospira variabilis]MCG5499144.1 ParB/RepB/Spo0J family partition protein [Ectothiorhodospira variabilis]